jgi:hypothetical protein
MSFKAEQIARLAESGWARCESVADAVAQARLPAITRDHLATAISDDLWDAAERAVRALRDRLGRFADEVTYGIVLVPDPGNPGRMPRAPAPSRSSNTSSVGAPSGRGLWAVAGQPRPGGGRGARVLQSGRSLPDCESNKRWTFTLFPGEGLTDGQAESGTVLKGRVRFRLGKPDASSDPHVWLPPSRLAVVDDLGADLKHRPWAGYRRVGRVMCQPPDGVVQMRSPGQGWVSVQPGDCFVR